MSQSAESTETAASEVQPLVLTPPEPVPAIAPTQAEGMVTLSNDEIRSLDERVRSFANTVVNLDVHSEAFRAEVDTVHAMGSREIRDAAGMSNRMLDRPASQLTGGLMGEGTTVGGALIHLRQTIEDLDPSCQSDLFAPKKLFGFIPWGNKLRDYFAKFESSQSHINVIIESLYRGQDELRRDNAAIEQEKVNLWETMKKLSQYAYVGKGIDRALAEKVARLEVSSPEKARVVRDELLFYTRQKVTDLLTQQAVSVQGYLALDMIRKNNLELIKGVDRATTTTVSALRTAVMVASALSHQKLVLDQITALNRTTGDLIAGTSVMLKQQATQIQQGAANSTVAMDKLKTAFTNIYQTMDAMSDFKGKALDGMQVTVDTLSGELHKAQAYLDRARQQDPPHRDLETTAALEL